MTNGLSIPASKKLEGILSSPVRLRIARLLTEVPEKELTGRELSRLVGVSHSSVQEAMKILVASGFVSRRSVGKAHLFRANRESYLYRIMETLFREERDVHEELGEELRSAFREVASSITVFGSYARGKAGLESDLDVVLIARDPKSAEERAQELGQHFLRKYALRLSAKVLSAADLRRKRSVPFIRAARRQGVVIMGPSLDEVIVSGRREQTRE